MKELVPLPGGATLRADPGASISAMHGNGVFCVNLLPGSDQMIADTFAGRTDLKGDSRFSIGEWGTLVTGTPVLLSRTVSFDCRFMEVKSVASHDVIFGHVLGIRKGAPGPALILP